MEIDAAIRTRHSYRHYEAREVDKDTVQALLDAAVQAPTAMNSQPWAFGVLQGAKTVAAYSEAAKKHLLAVHGEEEWLAHYRERLESPEFNIFYGAPVLVLIYAHDKGPMVRIDACLAAENLMLAACDKGLATCWIGFASAYFGSDSVKQELGVPAECQLVAPIVVGYPEGDPRAPEKNPPEVLFWK